MNTLPVMAGVVGVPIVTCMSSGDSSARDPTDPHADGITNIKIKGMLKRAFHHHHRHDGREGTSEESLSQKDVPSRIQTPTSLEVLRYRYHYGVNLGSIFVLEQWLYPSMFPSSATGGAELDAVTASIAKSGLSATVNTWRDHYSTALSDSDITYLAQTLHCTTIRLPIGYFTLGPTYCVSTPFDAASSVYSSAWSVVTSLCTRLNAAGIGVLIDFHALPGGANPDIHSGTSSGSAALWGNSQNLTLARSCLLFLGHQIFSGAVPGCVGLQLCNEAISNAPGLYDFYTDCLTALSEIDPTLPIYISDAWDLSTALKWCATQNKVATVGTSAPVIVDTHRYYCFSAANKAQSPSQIIASISNELSEIPSIAGHVMDNGAAAAIVGEYSCVIDPASWALAPTSGQSGPGQDALIKQFGQAQSARWWSRSAGCFFWTAKMDWMPGGAWGFYAMSTQGVVSPPFTLSFSSAEVGTRLAGAKKAKANLKNAAVTAHQTYWDKTSPGQTFQHYRYGEGYDIGFEDAAAFFGMRAGGGLPGAATGADTIGNLELWVRKRIGESGQQGSFVWEYEQGFRQGVTDAEGVLLAGQ